MTTFRIILSTLLLLAGMTATAQTSSNARHAWWDERNPPGPVASPLARVLPLIKVHGTRFVNDKGDTVLFRGMATSDPDNVESNGQWNKAYFEHIKDLGTMIVRLPVHPMAWKGRTPEKYLHLLDQAVEWCASLSMYVVIDWHSIGNLKMGLFQDPVYNTTEQETYQFWRTIAVHFKGNTTVAFYELFNEPTTCSGTLGRMSWDEWKKINENIIALIRANDEEKIPLVAGLDWAYDLTPLQNSPVEAAGIGYVVHPYPHKRTPPYSPKWDEDFGFAARQFPVFATEFSFTLGDEGIAANGAYGREIIEFMESRGISWMGWVFDPDWRPQVIRSWSTFKLTEAGEFFRDALHGNVVPKSPANRKPIEGAGK